MKKTSYDALKKLLDRAQTVGINPELIALAEEGLKDIRIDGTPVEKLSTRELQVLVAISSGLRPQEAADRYGLSVKTFSTYRARVLEKLEVGSNAEMAILAFELNLVPSVLSRYLKGNQDECSGVTANPDAKSGTD